jgi:hypothetical protein
MSSVWAAVAGGHCRVDRLDGSDFLETVLPGLFEDVRLAVGQKLWFQRDGASTNCGKDIRLVG